MRTSKLSLAVPAWTVLTLGDRVPALPDSFDRWGGVLAVDDPELASDLGLDDGTGRGADRLDSWILLRPDGYVSARGARDTPVPVPTGYR